MQNVSRIIYYFKKKNVLYFVLAFLIVQLFLSIKISDISLYEPNKRQNDYKTNDSTYISLLKYNYSPLDFLLPKCFLKHDAKDAINRTKSFQCKSLITKIACLQEKNQIYPPKLTPTCPLFNKSKVLGCFKEPPDSIDITDESINMKPNSHQICVDHCFNMQFKYAHVQNGYICHCGFNFNSYGPVNYSNANESHLFCNHTTCDGDSSKKEFCGTAGSAITINTGFVDKSQFNIKTIAASFTKAETGDVELGKQPKIKIVFTFILNGRADRQVLRFLRSIYTPDHYYLIHVDARRTYLYHRLFNALKVNRTTSTGTIIEDLPFNVKFLSRRFTPIWGGTSLLDVLLYSLHYLLRLNKYLSTRWKWDYFINLSESDFLVRPLDELVNILTLNNGTNFVKGHSTFSSSKFIQKQGIRYLFHECDNHLWRISPKDLIKGLAYDGASDWLILSRYFGTYMIADGLIENPFNYYERENKPLPLEKVNDGSFTRLDMELVYGLKQFYFQSLLPAESFFQTLLLNSRFCGNYVTDNLHHIKWRRPSGCTCEYKKFVDWCGCSPHNFRTSDSHRLIKDKKSDEFIARKFEGLIDQNIVRLVEKELFSDSYIDIPSINTYWYNIFSSTHDDLDSDLFVGGNAIKHTYFDSFYRTTFIHHLNKVNVAAQKGRLQIGKMALVQDKDIDDGSTVINCFNFADSFSYHALDGGGKRGGRSLFKFKIDRKELLKAELFNYNDKFAGLSLTYKTVYHAINTDFLLQAPVGERAKFRDTGYRNKSVDYFVSELFVRFEPYVNPETETYSNLFERIEIGEKCDFKEQFFRNYGYMLSTNSETPRLLVEFSKNAKDFIEKHGFFRYQKHRLITLWYVWVNPIGRIEVVYTKTYQVDKHIDEISGKIEFVRPAHIFKDKSHVLPGVWSLYIIYQNETDDLELAKYALDGGEEGNGAFNFDGQPNDRRRNKRILPSHLKGPRVKREFVLPDGEEEEVRELDPEVEMNGAAQNKRHTPPYPRTMLLLHERKFTLLPPVYVAPPSGVLNMAIDRNGKTLDADFKAYVKLHFIDVLTYVLSNNDSSSQKENVIRDRPVIEEIAKFLRLPLPFQTFNKESVASWFEEIGDGEVIENLPDLYNGSLHPPNSKGPDDPKVARREYNFNEALNDIVNIRSLIDLYDWIDKTISWVWHVNTVFDNNDTEQDAQEKNYKKQNQNLCLVKNLTFNDRLRFHKIYNRYTEITNISKDVNDQELLQCLFPYQTFDKYKSVLMDDPKLLHCDDFEIKFSDIQEELNDDNLPVESNDKTEQKMIIKPVYPWSTYCYDPKSTLNNLAPAYEGG